MPAPDSPGLPEPLHQRAPVGLVRLLVLAVSAALVAGSMHVVSGAAGRGTGAAVPSSLPADVSAVPLGNPLPAPAGDGGFEVLQRQPGGAEPVGWDPCRPLRYVVNEASVPAPGRYLLAAAFADVQRVTGLAVVDEGLTDEPPDDARAAIQPERYGDRWAPVLVAWSDPVASPRLAGAVAGYAGPRWVDGEQHGTRRYVTGTVVLDGPQLAELAAGPAGLARAEGVLLHELGHLLGLDHVEDTDQLMYPSTTLLGVEFAEGDLRGLAAVSGRPCRTDW